ncbi:MAG: hypothetical protein CK532_07810 [Flavobacteriales bacterium]|nr:flippase-like domain-containing protein [Flavobacteriaceae bacterium]PHX91529.1 MAG: hypothetical protein CK532_07810 [Flavobacteriales bacterium]
MILVALAVFTAIGYKINWKETAESIHNAKPVWLLSAAILMLMAHFLRGWRWKILLEPTGYTIHIRRTFYSVLAGYFMNIATARGGEFLRCALTSKSEQIPLPILIGSVLTERIVDVLVLVLLSFFCLAIQFEAFFGFFNDSIFSPILQNLPWVVPIILASIFLVVWLLKKNKSKQENHKGQTTLLEKFGSGLQTIFKLKNPPVFILASLGIWLGYWLSTYCMLKSIDTTADLTIANALGVLIFSSLGIILPIPGGAGVYYTIAYGLTLIYHIPESHANTFGILTVAFSNILSMIFGGLAYLLLYFEIQQLKPIHTDNAER